MIYNSGTSTDGYNAGLIDGRIYVNNNNTQTTNNYPPLYNPDYELLEKALQQKQEVYNLRKSDIVSRINKIYDVAIKAERRNNGLASQAQVDYIKSFIENVKSVLNVDYSIEENYFNAVNWLNAVQYQVNTW